MDILVRLPNKEL